MAADEGFQPGKSQETKIVRPIAGPQTLGRNRDKQGITSLVKIAEWPAGANIQEITIQCWFTTAPLTADLLAAASAVRGRFVVDPSSDAIAALLATELNSVTDDSGFDSVDISMPGSPVIVKVPIVGQKNDNGDVIRNGSLGGGVLYAMASDGSTSLDFEVKGH